MKSKEIFIKGWWLESPNEGGVKKAKACTNFGDDLVQVHAY